VVVAYLRILKVILPCLLVRLLKAGDFIMVNKTTPGSALNWIFLEVSTVFSLNR